ncbi:hypothetical protein A3D42_02935 [Candidatus Nomurabacteria bacterium RIFCSPHIGHO2_02_FULL_41_18]|uniref:Resolvase/invertase-type recombinase catalytic domain-containing protein n=1 Tax=Candidatus Nomurabacteria bacterium RIFCSPHIGHO2_02_FULL_41_18 TaxID=1801754 RepID=A0A1F6W6J6_9BACT|nr:MAG: hypothetical protein A2737_02200 [Candidatus Nomurabacteria bacterium RIFCSPHIGHO2_01_FULL_41_71]OGI77511.1 MAG: hypothetical protein A3D42_02935 [Candidatus Nomurabacteria bacterium RIFCSPHIGHO2_02_FULL_41_18]OGI89528.1 MAG: hypothetical protein A3B01_00015 [Candidatus Nomurabacteria bacterium RIFCSPLOWO2_01_FULL_41_52b]OGJ00361.1 MAG: hypothetical protein A3I90_02945 [Candidatus Nomurabacteria bacterium RIFCSPLOWO2_02_FULL_41_9]
MLKYLLYARKSTDIEDKQVRSIDEDIEQDEYLAEKAGLLSRKKSLEEKMTELEKGNIIWLEPVFEKSPD